MPFDPLYGLPIEAGTDLPGWSLTGGPDVTQPILAEAVAAQLARIDDRIQALQDAFGTYPEEIQAGTATITPDTEVVNTFYNASYWRGSTVVNYASSFSGIPSVFACAQTTVPGTVIEITISALNATSMTITGARQNTTAFTVLWIASSRTQT